MNWNAIAKQFGELVTSFMRSALAAGIALVLSQQMNLMKLTADEWTLIANAAIAAGLVTVYNFLNPNDDRYGLGAYINGTSKSSEVTDGGQTE